MTRPSTAFRDVVVNAPIGQLGRRHGILWGRSRSHHVRDFEGPLSIKSVIRGAARWTTDAGRVALDEATYLVVNDRQPYSIDLESEEPVETFCVFFRRGFVEQARAVLAGRQDDLDAPEVDAIGRPGREGGGFVTLRAGDAAVLERLRVMHGSLARGRPPGAWLVDAMVELADALLRAQADVRRAIARVPAARPATRTEIYRRLRRAADFVEASLADAVPLEAMARAACLSPFHFHRRFTETFGETPHQFVRRRRLERARDLLLKTALPVAVVCHRTGFQSLGSFSTLFRRRYGVPPLTCRRQGAPNSKFREKPPASFRQDSVAEERSLFIGQEGST